MKIWKNKCVALSNTQFNNLVQPNLNTSSSIFNLFTVLKEYIFGFTKQFGAYRVGTPCSSSRKSVHTFKTMIMYG